MGFTVASESEEVIFLSDQSQARILGQGQDDIPEGARWFWKDQDSVTALYIMGIEFKTFNLQAKSPQETVKKKT